MKRIFLQLVISLAVAIGLGTKLSACPFCTATSQTLTEEMNSADVVVLARLANPSLSPEEGPDALGGFGIVDPDTGLAEFEIYGVIKGKDHIVGIQKIEVVFFGPPEKEKSFWITGIGTGPIDWTTPLPLSERAVEYVGELQGLPEKGADRLEFFMRFLEDDDALLKQDAYDEFARAPYDKVIEIKDRMDHDQLVDWITNPNCGPSRRRLYLTMLGVCGSDDDLPMLEEMILSDFREVNPVVQSLVQASLLLGGPISAPLVAEVVEADQRRKKLGLDAMIACYLTLAGPNVLDAIDARFLSDSDAEYTHIYNVLMALRFHGEETEVIPRDRLFQSVRLLLEHPDFADQVIPDLARWEDWSILDRLVTMFNEAEKRSFVRQPVVTYLVVASEQEGEVGERATKALQELKEIDPDTVERAESLMAYGFLQRARPANKEEEDRSNYTRDGSPFGNSKEEEQPELPDPASEQFTTEGSTPSPLELPVDEDEDTKRAEEAEPSVPPPLASDREAERLQTPHTGLIVGIPLLAGLVLMGLFWLILRSGIA